MDSYNILLDNHNKDSYETDFADYFKNETGQTSHLNLCSSKETWSVRICSCGNTIKQGFSKQRACTPDTECHIIHTLQGFSKQRACTPDTECSYQSEDLTKVADVLHTLIDSLPLQGAGGIVNIVWRCEEWPDLEENLDLYGALRCLVEWYHAHITLLHWGSETVEDVPRLKSWAVGLRADACNQVPGLKPLCGLQWRGDIRVDQNYDKTDAVILPGFSLQQWTQQGSVLSLPEETLCNTCDERQRVLSTSLEFIEVFDIAKIPLYAVTSKVYTLTLPSFAHTMSRQFFRILHENRKLCYMVRLKYGKECTASVAPGHESTNWTDNLVSNNNTQPPPVKLDFSGDVGFYHFLIYSDGNSCNNEWVAQMLRPTHAYSGAIADTLQRVHQTMPGPLDEDTKQKVDDILQCIPHYNGETFTQIETNIDNMVIDYLNKYIEEKTSVNEPCNMPIDTFNLVISTIRDTYWDRIKSSDEYELPRLHMEEHDGRGYQCTCTDKNEEPIEKLQLLKRFEDSTIRGGSGPGGLSPPPKSEAVMLDAKEMLKYFKSDGSALQGAFSDIKFQKESLTKHDSGETKTADWPLAEHCSFHDVYYNVGKQDEIETKSSVFRQRIKCIETASTCNTEQAQSPANIALMEGSKQDGEEEKKVGEGKGTRRGRPRGVDGKRKIERKEAGDTAESLKRDGRKRKLDENELTDPKRLIQSKKRKMDTLKEQTNASSSACNETKPESRSQRHKRKLQEVVIAALTKEGVHDGDKMFKKCFQKLCDLVKMFAKELRGYKSLRAEMEKIANSHVKQVVDFQRQNVP